jgi:hypothetical protein
LIHKHGTQREAFGRDFAFGWHMTVGVEDALRRSP